MDQHEIILVPQRVFDENADCWQTYANSGKFDDFIQWWLTVPENDTLWDIYRVFNESLDMLIDRYEDEELPADKVEAAINIAEDFREKKTGELETAAFDKLMQALKKAKELGRPVYFWF